ncbi:MAG: crossover junction endodeoxyribonuclease RuvC [Elusimicrobia bacterium]|nr:crossover junction endodeoxyribonuclease RuvC [Elusimicrobiota bacterium]
MIILGVDPGLALTGWGLVKAIDKNRVFLVDYGCIKTKPAQTLSERLKFIYQDLTNIIQAYKPNAFALEELFFSKEARTVAAVSQARGVVLLSAALSKIPLYEYNPRHVKIALTGYGSADKAQIQQMVKTLLGMKEIPKPDDAADALAIAICHLNTAKW